MKHYVYVNMDNCVHNLSVLVSARTEKDDLIQSLQLLRLLFSIVRSYSRSSLVFALSQKRLWQVLRQLQQEKLGFFLGALKLGSD